MIRQRHAEATGGAAGLGRERGIAHHERGGCLVDRLGGVGLLDSVVADWVGVEFALDEGGASGGLGEEIGSVVGGCLDCGKVVLGFESAAGERVR